MTINQFTEIFVGGDQHNLFGYGERQDNGIRDAR